MARGGAARRAAVACARRGRACGVYLRVNVYVCTLQFDSVCLLVCMMSVCECVFVLAPLSVCICAFVCMLMHLVV